MSRLARMATGDSHASLDRWECTALGLHAGPATRGVVRVQGMVHSRDEIRPWSAVLKALARQESADDVFGSDGVLYWAREADAYESGLLETLPGGIASARCLDIWKRPDGSIWLWTEDVHDRFGDAWPLQQYRVAARTLGRFNGAYLVGRPLPDVPWMTRPATLRGMLQAYAPAHSLAVAEETWMFPLLRGAFHAPPISGLHRLWSLRGALLDALEALPMTLCHKDAWRGNLFAADDPERDLTAIDWAYVGPGELGIDAGDLFGASFPIAGFDPHPLDEAVFGGHVEGLTDAGWDGDPAAARFGYAAFAALKYASVPIWLREVLDRRRHASLQRWSGLPVERYVERQAALMPYLIEIALKAVDDLNRAS